MEAVAHQFQDFRQQHEASRLGMWTFLVTEVMFFGGLIAGYTVYRIAYPAAFAQASNRLDVALGAVNTVLLLASSFTMALAVRSARRGGRWALAGALGSTLLLGAAFLAIKGFEYAHKAHEQLVPGPNFRFEGPEAKPAELFFSFYFLMTGMHAVHMVVGIGVLAVLAALAARGAFTPDRHAPVELAGLYWHFVDVVWIFLLPILYLVGRHAP